MAQKTAGKSSLNKKMDLEAYEQGIQKQAKEAGSGFSLKDKISNVVRGGSKKKEERLQEDIEKSRYPREARQAVIECRKLLKPAEGEGLEFTVTRSTGVIFVDNARMESGYVQLAVSLKSFARHSETKTYYAVYPPGQEDSFYAENRLVLHPRQLK